MGFNPHPSNYTHFWAGFLLASMPTLFFYYEIRLSFILSSLIGVFVSLIFGYAKEYFDKKDTGVFDTLDLIYTVIGGIAFCVLLYPLRNIL